MKTVIKTYYAFYDPVDGKYFKYGSNYYDSSFWTSSVTLAFCAKQSNLINNANHVISALKYSSCYGSYEKEKYIKFCNAISRTILVSVQKTTIVDNHVFVDNGITHLQKLPRKKVSKK